MGVLKEIEALAVSSAILIGSQHLVGPDHIAYAQAPTQITSEATPVRPGSMSEKIRYRLESEPAMNVYNAALGLGLGLGGAIFLGTFVVAGIRSRFCR